MSEFEILASEALLKLQNPKVSLDELTPEEALEIFFLRILPLIFLPQSSEDPSKYKKKFEQYIKGRKMSADTDVSIYNSHESLSEDFIDEDLLEGQIETRFRIALKLKVEDAKAKGELPDFAELRLNVWRNLHIPEQHEVVALKVFDAAASRVLTEFLTQFTDQLVREVTAKRMAQTITELRNRLEGTLKHEFNDNEHYMFYSLASLLNAPDLATIETSSPLELTSDSIFISSAIEQLAESYLLVTALT